ncbi:MAG: nitrophenyl compound nitroreductase subunit ArsF family protein [Bacteroidales bacterium]|nr:nitrophenyl compound nitroreductase subunit ArsF family protein [Bacteroidales bacterium]
MKNSVLVLAIALASIFNFSAKAQSTEDQSTSTVTKTADIEVYYFHNTRRCATCNAVEQVTRETLEEGYPEQMKSGVITFQSLNIEEGETEALAKKLGVSGQTLLIVKGDKKTDLTNDAFMYARTKPDKLKEKVKNAIDQD